MKLGVINVLFGNKPLEETLKYFKSIGIEELEVGAGGYPGKAHCDPEVLLSDEKKFNEFKSLFEKYDLKINALGCHGNPVHPDKEIADKFRSDWHNAVLLAEKLGVKKIIGFSGCPGDCESSRDGAGNTIGRVIPSISVILEYCTVLFSSPAPMTLT